MVRTCCEKRSKAEHDHAHMRTEDSPSGTNLNHWMLHIFIEHISYGKICRDCFFILHFNQSERKEKHTLQTIAKFVL